MLMIHICIWTLNEKHLQNKVGKAPYVFCKQQNNLVVKTNSSFKLVGNEVRKKSAQHFNCSQVDGLELENNNEVYICLTC